MVNAARVSFDKESDWDVPETDPSTGGKISPYHRLTEKDQKLISYLAKHGHWTPFSHPQITIRETVPIFVARQRFKHMIGFTYNEVSRRYVDDEPEFYVPEVWRSRPEGSVKQGSGGSNMNSTIVYDRFKIGDAYALFLDHAEVLYKGMIEAGVAPEQARMVLPQSMYTSYYVTGSLAAFARAYNQRIDAHAQVEIQELAKQWSAIIQPLFPCSWRALTNDNRDPYLS